MTFDEVRLIPLHNNVASRTEPDLRTKLTKESDLSFPILAANMESVTGTELAKVLYPIGSTPMFPRFVKTKFLRNWGQLFPGCFISCGLDRKTNMIESLLDEYPINILIDVAQGHDTRSYNLIEFYKKNWPEKQIVAGNVCTAEGYRDLVNAGADAVKVGIGPGSVCTTTDVTGFGVPQMQAVLDVGRVAKKLRVPFIADGGIRNSGDIVKCLAAGASSVMIGKLFAQCHESAAKKTLRGIDCEPYALYRGQASRAFQAEGFTPEGKEEWVPITGNAKELINVLCMGIRSGFTYGGSRDIYELQRKAEFMEISP